MRVDIQNHMRDTSPHAAPRGPGDQVNHPACITPDRMAAIAASVPRAAIVDGPRFASVSCSQCGQSFGPGPSGYSHCWEHSGTPEQRATLDRLQRELARAEELADEFMFGRYSLQGSEAYLRAGTLRKKVKDLRAAMVGSAA